MSEERSLIGSTDQLNTLPLQAHTGALNGTAVDFGPCNDLTFVFNLGTWTDGTHVVTFEEDINGDATWTAIPANCLEGHDRAGVQQLDVAGASLTIGSGARDNTTILVNYQGLAKKVRVVTTPAGTTTGAVYGVNVWRFRLRFVGMNPVELTHWNSDPNL